MYTYILRGCRFFCCLYCAWLVIRMRANYPILTPTAVDSSTTDEDGHVITTHMTFKVLNVCNCLLPLKDFEYRLVTRDLLSQLASMDVEEMLTSDEKLLRIIGKRIARGQ